MSGNIYLGKKEIKNGSKVFLNIYHITKLNYLLQFLGIGLYHTSIEINEKEYSYGSTENETLGIYINTKKDNEYLVLKERLYLGNTLYTEKNLNDLIFLEELIWTGRSYDPFFKNCNHFTKYFSNKILNDNVDYPEYVNRIMEYGMFLHCFYQPIKFISTPKENVQFYKTINNVQIIVDKNMSDSNEYIHFKNVFKNLNSLNPYTHNSNNFYKIINSYINVGDYDHAIDILIKNSNQDEEISTTLSILHNLVYIYELMDNNSMIEYYLKKIIELNLKDRIALAKLSLIYIYNNENDIARDLLNKIDINDDEFKKIINTIYLMSKN